jgi:hypothetical protein
LAVTGSAYPTLTLSQLPASETFRSHTDNALKKGMASIVNGRIDLALAPLSITAILLSDDPNDLPPPGAGSGR